MIWSGTSPITRARPPRHGHREVGSGAIAPDVHGPLDPVGHLDRRDLPDRPAALEHELRHERLEVGEDEDVGPPPRRDRAEVRRARGRWPG